VELSVVEVGLVILLPLSVVIRLLPFVIELDDLFARLVRDLERETERQRGTRTERERGSDGERRRDKARLVFESNGSFSHRE
jgi:hypothetical protein